MSMIRRLGLLALTAAVAMSTIAAEDAAVPAIEASATTAGSTVTVTGTAAGADVGVQDVGGALTAFGGAAVGDHVGLGLQAGFIEHIEGGLRFTWDLSSLPAPPAPEAIRYTWSFGIEDQTFQLQAKTTNLVGTTTLDDPAGHVTHVGETFQMRGNCTDSYQGTPVSNCPHVTFLTGAFDTSAGAVTIDVPYGSHEMIQPGAVIVPVETATMSIAASGQAAVSNTLSSAYINAWERYHIGLAVFIGFDDADEDPAKVKVNEPVTLNEDGTFTGTLDLADADTGEIVWARACTGITCTAIPLG